MFYGYCCPKFYIYWNNKIRHYIFGNEINLKLLIQSFHDSNNNGIFQYYLHLRLLRSCKEQLQLVFFNSFYHVFVLNILLVNVQVSHNKNNGHRGKYFFDDKTDICRGVCQVWVIETVGVFQMCPSRKRQNRAWLLVT